MNPTVRLAANRAACRDRLTARTAATGAIEDLRARAETDPASVTTEQVRAAVDARAAIDAEIDLLESVAAELRAEIERDAAMERLAGQSVPGTGAVPVPPLMRDGSHLRDGVIVSEERTYSPDKSAQGSASFFRDLYLSSKPGSRDFQAEARLQRHDREVQVEQESRGRERTERATTTSSFAGLIPPQYLVDQYALIMRAGRPVANTVVGMQIPDEGMSFVIPRGTTGAGAAVQASENATVSSTDEVWANLTVPVITVAGQQDISRQSLERGTPGIDEIIFMDIAGAYGVALDQQVISGTGSSGQALGILNTSGVNQATAFTAAATAQTLYSKTAGQLAAIETTRFLAPDIIWMHPRRWNWLLTQFDTQNRPLVVPLQGQGQAINALGTFSAHQDTPAAVPAGTFLGLPVVTDASIPTAVGTGPEDQIIVARREDLMLWEDGDGMPQRLEFEQTLGANLTVKLVAYGYAAFTAGRYPTAVGIVGGNAGTAGFGLVAPTF